MSQVEERADRKSLEGWVVSDKMNKTRVIEIRWSKQHPEYGKVMNKQTKLYAHDEKNETHAGDHVRVMETRPMSRLKRWRINEVLHKKAVKE